MRSGIFIMATRGEKKGLKEIPDPPRGKRHIVVLVSAQTHDVITSVDPNGHWEAELAAAIERTVDEFVRSRPIQIRTPGRAVSRAGLSLYDHRDPTRERIN